MEFEEQGWRTGDSAPLPPVWPEFDSDPVSCVGRVCCWFSPCSEGFSLGSPVFQPSQKPTSLNSNSTRIEDQHENQVRGDAALPLNIFIYSFIHFFFIYKTNSAAPFCGECAFRVMLDVPSRTFYCAFSFSRILVFVFFFLSCFYLKE